VIWEKGKKYFREKMRVALALILLISLATAFKLEKERPVSEDDVEKQDEGDNKLESLEERIFGENYCCTHICFVTPPECHGK